MAAQATGLIAHAEVVRVLTGRLSGKEYAFSQQDRICIGHALANDLVLRGQGTRGTMLELRRNGEAMVLRVLHGRVELLGRPLEEGEEAALPPYLPFRLGEFLLAHGRAGSDRWEEVTRFAAPSLVASSVPLPEPRLSQRLYRIGCEHIEQVDKRISLTRLAIGGLSLFTLVVAGTAIWSDVEARNAAPPAFEHLLKENGFGSLLVTSSPAGGLVVSGVVADEAQLTRLDQLASSASVPVMLDVHMPGELANAATDILLAQGLDAEASPDPASPAGLIIRAPYMTADRKRELGALLKRDLPGLGRIRFAIDDALGGNALQSFFSASGAGLATVVEDPPHIVTADGSRWFPGAVLPTGHRLISIGNGRIRFEKDERVEELEL